MMEHRLGRTLRVFLAVLALAGVYRLAVVPIVEPRSRPTPVAAALTPEQAAAIRSRADRRLAAVDELFPDGSWERDDPIKVENRQMRLLFKEYHSLPDGRVNLVPCTLMVLPDRNRSAPEDGGGRTLVLRAPQGAVLELDEPLDLRQGRFGRLIGGSLRGQVTVRGTPSVPGGDDDIEIVTRDVTLDQFQVQTNEMVQFRYGRSSGSGRGFVAQLRPREGPAGQGPNIGGVDSVRLDRDVRARLEGLAGGLMPGQPRHPAAAGEPPPVLVSCRGALCLNVSANVITLEDQVDVVRTGSNAAVDRLACDLLAITLGKRDAEAAAGESRRGGLEPVSIQAKGTPVVVVSTSERLEARAQRLGYEIATRRILLDGDDPVSLSARGTEMESRKLDYLPGPDGAPGALVAVGPGWLRGQAEGSPPVRVRWQKWLRMRPDGTGHVVSIDGDAEVAVEKRGRLGAAEMHLWLETLPAAPGGPQAAVSSPGSGPDLGRLRPSKLLAKGLVEADADAGGLRTEQLEFWFRSVMPAPPPKAVPAAAGPTGAAAPAAAAPAQPPPPAAPQPRGRLLATAELVRGLVVLAPQANDVEELSMLGQVRLVEQPPAAAAMPGGPAAAPAEPPLEILGDQLQLVRPQNPEARATVAGRPARVQGRGLDLEGGLIQFDRGRGGLKVDGAGRLQLPIPAGQGSLDVMNFASGPAPPPPAAPAAPGRMEVTWQGRMDFDGLTARFVDQVVASSGRTAVRSGSLDVSFDRPFKIGAEGVERAGPQPEVARIACGSGVRIESESAEAENRSREQLFVRDLVIDRLTGDVAGNGPGRLTSTRLGQPPALGLADGGRPPAAQPVAAVKSAPGLTYLGVDFQRGLRGNIHRRTLEFQQRVEAIWGPVANWSATLDPHAASGLPPGVFTVACDVLGLGQAPVAAPTGGRPSVELAAAGNVLVEGESFTGRSARLSWSEAKDLLVFEGDGRTDAQIFRQLHAGAQPQSMSAGKLLYWRSRNHVDVKDARFLDLDQLRGGGAAGPAAAPARQRAPPQTPQRALPAT